MFAPVDLDAYLERIQWAGAVRQDLHTLTGLTSAHARHIPFENLDVLLGRPIRLDLQGVQDKLVAARRGGYCFEHATLLAAVLETLGFKPVRHAARVVMFVPRTAAPRTHMFLTVSIEEGTFVLDPGFGGLAPRIPVPLVDGQLAQLGHERHWMVRDGRLWMLRAQLGDRAIDGWVSSVEEENLVDFEMGNHFTATHPSSPFLNRIMLRALTDDGRITVMNRDVTVWHGPHSVTTQLADRNALRTVLAEHFGFDVPQLEQLRVPSIAEWA